ncbi:MAG TPA: methyltransferase domain-containing protein [Candidatus Acidoferrales bacterium]|nr:methyltransferase domain-containing protein [Candidatus Acidoferrales bacterium]
MHDNLMELLRCPACRDEMVLSVYEHGGTSREVSCGLLRCSCNRTFPIWHGVPRMLLATHALFPEEFTARFENQLRQDAPEIFASRKAKHVPPNYSFDVEWSMYRFQELTWELDLASRVRYVYEYLRMPPGGMDGATVLDAGCGNGTLSTGIVASGPRVVALDYSECIERAEAEKKRSAGAAADRLDYVQGDLQHPPFAPGSFDVVYSDGVLHHTPDTRASFAAVAPLVKEHGRMFVWLYRSDLQSIYRVKSVAIKTIRSALRPLPAAAVRRLCYGGAVALQARLQLLRLVGIRKRRIVPVWLKAVNLFDTFTPLYNHQHVPDEVTSWFQEEGFPQAVETTIPSLGHMGFGVLGVRDVGELPADAEHMARPTPRLDESSYPLPS